MSNQSPRTEKACSNCEFSGLTASARKTCPECGERTLAKVKPTPVESDVLGVLEVLGEVEEFIECKADHFDPLLGHYCICNGLERGHKDLHECACGKVWTDAECCTRKQ